MRTRRSSRAPCSVSSGSSRKRCGEVVSLTAVVIRSPSCSAACGRPSRRSRSRVMSISTRGLAALRLRQQTYRPLRPSIRRQARQRLKRSRPLDIRVLPRAFEVQVPGAPRHRTGHPGHERLFPVKFLLRFMYCQKENTMNFHDARLAVTVVPLLVVAALCAAAPASGGPLYPCDQVCICPIPCIVKCTVDGVPTTCRAWGGLCGGQCPPAPPVAFALAAPMCPAGAGPTLRLLADPVPVAPAP